MVHPSPRSRPQRRVALATLGVASVAAGVLGVPQSAAPAAAPAALAADGWFHRTATYPVFQNLPSSVDPASETVAEIADVTDDGNTVVYTDAAGGRIGFLDITDPSAPAGAGTYELADGDSPTSVAAIGDYVLVVVDSSDGDFVNPSGRLDVIRFTDHSLVASIDLGGQPDSIAIAPSGDYAAVAIENQRDEEFTPVGGDEGDLPQLPAGFVQSIELAGTPDTWTATPIPLDETTLAGLDAPSDAEVEYVDINAEDQLALTLQENNGVAIVDLPTGTVENAFSAGRATVHRVDTDNDGVFAFTDTIIEEREPDSIQWVGDGYVATANEGDWKGGSRGWSVFDVATGDVVWDAGRSFEMIAVRHGLFNNDRADNKGAEPEGLAFEVMGGTPYAFVGSERSNFVAVYDMTDPADPALRQVLPTTNGPEGLLPIPDRDLLVVSSEEDDAEALVRATVGVYALGSEKPAFPSIVSAAPEGNTPIGWGALSALSSAPGTAGRVWAASDAAYATGRIYGVDITRRPAVIDEVIEVTDGGVAGPVDIEGLFARPGGGFWVAQEGTGADNVLLRLDDSGEIVRTVSLPTEVTDHVRNWGLEGVTAVGRGKKEQVYVALQRPLWVDPSVPAGSVVPLEGNVARIGRWTPATGEWSWFSYELGEPSGIDGDWNGLSEIAALDNDTLAVIERDKQNGTTAAYKKVVAIDIPAPDGDVTPVVVRRVLDVLPALQAPRGWTQEKLEGFTVTTDGRALAVTDNDGLEDATGETVLLRLGNARRLFGHGTSTRVSGPRRARAGDTLTVTVTVRRGDLGRVVLSDGGDVVATKRLAAGTASFRVRDLAPGRHRFRARYLGSALAQPSRSDVLLVTTVS